MAATVAAPVHLPPSLSSFVGRRRELAAIGELLGRCRLLTLTGSGGIGKTRLAAEAAALVREGFPDGVVFVSLAAVGDPAAVLPAIAAALEVGEETARPLPQQLAAALAGRRLLLVLDNLEQVLPAAPLLAGLLGACPDLRVLATSREPLRLLGEQEYPLAPLGLPEARHARSPLDLAASEAVQLFLERARLILPDFALTADNAGVVAAICRRLDGLPLALELAAARLRLFSPAELLDRLAASDTGALALLAGGPRDLPARQQTMRATIAWSYDLLPPEEQALFRHLAIFPAGFTLEAAEALLAALAGPGAALPPGPPTAGSAQQPDRGPGRGDEPEARRPGADVGIPSARSSPSLEDRLEALLARSLLVRRQPAGGPRFGMLEAIHEFGLEQLRERGELETLRHGHRQYLLALAERALREHAAVADPPWWDRLLAEREGLQAGLRWCIERGDAGEALHLAAVLPLFCQSGRLAEGRQLLAQVLALPAPPGPEGAAARALALRGAGKLAWMQGDVAASHRYFEESLALYRQRDDTEGLAEALRWAAAATSDAERTRALLADALRLARERGSLPGQAMALNSMGEHCRLAGDYAAARAHYVDALRLLETAGEVSHTALLLANLGFALLRLGDLAGAERHFHAALGRRAQGDWGTLTAYCLAGLGGLAAARGQHARGVRLLAAGQVVMEGQDAAFGGADRLEFDRDLATLRSVLGEEAFAAAWAEGRALAREEALALALAQSDDPGAPDRAPVAGRSAAAAGQAGGLSAREREVALLVAEGYTNRRIAERLVISERTADAHVANILAKLGLSNRAQVAAWVAGGARR